MDSTALYFGGFFIVWGLLYMVFAFVARHSGFVGSLFKVPGIFIFLPERMVIPVGRVLTGLMCIAFGVFFIVYMSQQGAV